MSSILTRYLQDWWEALVHPDFAGELVLQIDARRGFSRFLIAAITLLYAVYGFSMGTFRGFIPGIVSGIKLPCMFFLSLTITLPAFYTLNCLYGPRLSLHQCLRLLLLAISANAAALGSYGLISFFFTMTTSRAEYNSIVLMHVIVFALAGSASIAVITLIFRAAATASGWNYRPLFVFAWALLYTFVGTQMSWVLRPWIGSWSVPYKPFRPLQGSFFEAVWNLIQ